MGPSAAQEFDPAPAIEHEPCCKCKNGHAYRVLRPDEDPGIGLSASDPAANYSVEGHVLHASKDSVKTQYISASRTYEQAVTNSTRYGTGKERIASIDLSQAQDSLDLNSDCSPLKGTTARRRAQASGEVLIVGRVPPSAIKIVGP